MRISRRTGRIAGFIAALGMGLMAVFQVLALAGAAFWPSPPAAGESLLPARLATVFLLFLGGYLAAGRAGLIRRQLLPRLYDAGVWFAAVLLLLRGVGNFQDLGLFRNVQAGGWAQFDIRILSPLFLALGAACLLLALSPKEKP